MGQSQSSSEAHSTRSSGTASHNRPTPSEIRAVRRILAQRGLPAELIFLILDEAAYYASVCASLRDARHYGDSKQLRAIAAAHDTKARIEPPLRLDASRHCTRAKTGGSCAARLCLLAPPLLPGAPGETWHAKAVIWDIWSHDQGWGGETQQRGSFEGAYSWFEASIFRKVGAAEHPGENSADDTVTRGLSLRDLLVGPTKTLRDALEERYCTPAAILPFLAEFGYTAVTHPSGPDGQESMVWPVQRNRVAHPTFTHYHVEWRTPADPDTDADATERARERGCGSGAGFLEALRPGDIVALWMRAQYPGWANHVNDASVKVLYDVY